MVGDPGLPQTAIDQGYTSQSAWNANQQQLLQQKLSDQQIAAQKAIADQQNQFNQQQLTATQDLQKQQAQQAADQANRQSTYDTGRAQQLTNAGKSIGDAFASFSPQYYNDYAQSYMNQVNDQLGYQRGQANRAMLFGLARQGLSDSQALADQTGLLEEAQGRSVAEQTANAQGAASQLQSQVASAKNSLMQQVAQAQSIGSPIAGATLGDVNSALNTQQNAISGITSNAGDVISSLKGVPTVSSLGNIFAGLLGNLGSYMSGVNSNNANAMFNLGRSGGLSGTNPSGAAGATSGGKR